MHKYWVFKSPGQHLFLERQNSYWSRTAAEVTPAYIIRPNSAAQVGRSIDELVKAKRKFAIRSGGHAQNAGANNIEDGITIDLSLLDHVRFSTSDETVDIGPGALWKHVYTHLSQFGRVVAGGRDGNVGVGGVILGGGYSFFVAQRGFACDDVVAFEVVLANGTCITADSNNHPLLFKVLKGGSNNFGVVTNIRMKAIENKEIWGGLNFFDRSIAGEAMELLVEFTQNCHLNKDSHLLFFFMYTDNTIVTAYVQLDGSQRASSFKKFLGLPSTLDTTKTTTIAAVVSEYDIAPQDYYNTFFTISVQNDIRIVNKAHELHERLVNELKTAISDGDFVVQCLIQPLPRNFGHRSAETNGNIMGVEHHPVDGLLLVAVAMVRTLEQQSIAYAKLRQWVDDLDDYASKFENGVLSWVYMNYADKSQAVLESYGASNVSTMKDVAARYDPDQVFQRLCPGGFKLSDVVD
ncbi:hypothetical protein F5Y16DRAFT_420372 [Xylariaceae sp. FL0255]|nr:hypothetical protein F5Y16DRAFT_420372 [Xylariaceae sp. FL0255]